MPDIIKISELDEALALADAAEFPYYQDNGGQNTTYKAPITQIGAKIVEGLTYQGINLPEGAGNKTVENSLNYLINAIGGDPNGNISDSYDPTAAYVKGDLCIYENVLYICTAPTTGTFDPSNWTATTIDNVIGSLSTLTTTVKSSLVGAVNELNKVTALTISGVPTGVTNNSKAYKINEGLILIMIEVTFSSASSSWQNAFDIAWSGRTIVNAFGALSNDNDNNTYAQAYWNTDKITVRVSSPKATLYRGQILIPAT